MPKVSFILPAYKRRFLKQAIDSILAQTYRDFELIVVDDHSPQNLREVVDAYSDPRLTYHCNEVNIGGKDLVAAWNKALSYAKGEFVVCASDDDVYHQEYLQEMLALAEKYPNVNEFHCRIAVIDECGGWLYVGLPRAEYETGLQMMLFRGIQRCDSQRMPDFMIRTRALREEGGYFSTRRAWCSDAATTIRLALKGGVCCSPRILFHWRASSENISSLKSDYMDKIVSTTEFYSWLRNSIAHHTPRSEEERHLLELCRKGVDSAWFGSYQGPVAGLPLLHWVRAVSTKGIPPLQRNMLVAARVKRLFMPWF